MKSLLLRSLVVLSLFFSTTPLYCADLTITAASVVKGANARTVRKIAGTTITAGQVVYLDAADSYKAKLADANLSAAASTVYGIAAHGSTSGQPLTIIVQDDDLTLGATVVIGDTLILSATAGGVAPVADNASGYYTTVLGVAKSTTKINFHPVAAGAVKP